MVCREAPCRSIVVAAEWRNTRAPEVGALMPARVIARAAVCRITALESGPHGAIEVIEIIRICGGGLRIRCYPREDLTHKRLSSGGKTGCYASWTSSKTIDGFWL